MLEKGKQVQGTGKICTILVSKGAAEDSFRYVDFSLENLRMETRFSEFLFYEICYDCSLSV